MLVELKNGETLNGHLVNCDTWMNLTLKEVVQTSPEGDKFFRLPEVYVRGNNVRTAFARMKVNKLTFVIRSNTSESPTRSLTLCENSSKIRTRRVEDEVEGSTVETALDEGTEVAEAAVVDEDVAEVEELRDINVCCYSIRIPVTLRIEGWQDCTSEHRRELREKVRSPLWHHFRSPRPYPDK